MLKSGGLKEQESFQKYGPLDHLSQRIYEASSPSLEGVLDGRRSAVTGCDFVRMGDVWVDGGEPASWSRSSKLASALRQLAFLSPATNHGLSISPECIDRRCGLLVFLLCWGRAGAAAGCAVITATNQVPTGAEVFATTVTAGSQHAGRSELDRLFGVPAGSQSAEVITADLA